ncbi:hypothetical protein ZIOFF_042679 [Zingiber officinale]|uniref:Uncharacterized protein n=1 Tax=Zingiber officinale TaxID=94328 RepID=A0A8J5FW15_ZINOF|nr:hypothetical protein ZIOFF_042679 [Zingiber officinale]
MRKDNVCVQTFILSCINMTMQAYGHTDYSKKWNSFKEKKETAVLKILRILVSWLLRFLEFLQRATEAEIKKRFADGGVILRPGYIYGTRPIGPLKIRFGRMWTPFEMVQLII